jgi:hypothetical protein
VKLFRPKREDLCPVPVLISYALVNRETMMDLEEGRSLINNLLALGLDIYIIVWGSPGRMDRFITLDDYIDIYLDDCVDFIRNERGLEKINLLGVCQGGTFTGIYTALHERPQPGHHGSPLDFDMRTVCSTCIPPHGRISWSTRWATYPGFQNSVHAKNLSHDGKYIGLRKAQRTGDQRVSWHGEGIRQPDQAGSRKFLNEMYEKQPDERRAGDQRPQGDLKRIDRFNIYAEQTSATGMLRRWGG